MPYRLAQHQQSPPPSSLSASPLRAVLRRLRWATARRAEHGRAVAEGARA